MNRWLMKRMSKNRIVFAENRFSTIRLGKKEYYVIYANASEIYLYLSNSIDR